MLEDRGIEGKDEEEEEEEEAEEKHCIRERKRDKPLNPPSISCSVLLQERYQSADRLHSRKKPNAQA